MFALAAVMAATVVLTPARLRAQDNTLDLRFLELDNKGNVTYQNFIYARMIDSSRWMAQALYLRLPSAGNYGESPLASGIAWRRWAGSRATWLRAAAMRCLALESRPIISNRHFPRGGPGKMGGLVFSPALCQADANGERRVADRSPRILVQRWRTIHARRLVLRIPSRRDRGRSVAHEARHQVRRERQAGHKRGTNQHGQHHAAAGGTGNTTSSSSVAYSFSDLIQWSAVARRAHSPWNQWLHLLQLSSTGKVRHSRA